MLTPSHSSRNPGVWNIFCARNLVHIVNLRRGTAKATRWIAPACSIMASAVRGPARRHRINAFLNNWTASDRLTEGTTEKASGRLRDKSEEQRVGKGRRR